MHTVDLWMSDKSLPCWSVSVVNMLLILFCVNHMRVWLKVFLQKLFISMHSVYLSERFGVFVLEWEREIGLSSAGTPHCYTNQIN